MYFVMRSFNIVFLLFYTRIFYFLVLTCCSALIINNSIMRMVFLRTYSLLLASRFKRSQLSKPLFSCILNINRMSSCLFWNMLQYLKFFFDCDIIFLPSYQDSLGGNAKTCIIANISPSSWYAILLVTTEISIFWPYNQTPYKCCNFEASDFLLYNT